MEHTTKTTPTIEQRSAIALLREHRRALDRHTTHCREHRTQLDRAARSLIGAAVRAGLTTDQITTALGVQA